MKYKSGDTVLLFSVNKTGMPSRFLGKEFVLLAHSTGYPEITRSGDTVWKAWSKHESVWHIAESMFRMSKELSSLDSEIYDIQTMGYRE